MLFFLISSFSLLVISITMLARANDLRWRKGAKWTARLFGFILSGTSPVGIVGGWFASGQIPIFYFMLFVIGQMLVFVTTPYLPPWWKWISGKDQSSPHWSDDRRKPQ